MTDAAAPQRAVGRTGVHEHVTALAHRTALLQVVGQRAADVDRQRQPAVASLPVDDQLAGAPIDVIEVQRGDAGAQPQAREHGQDRVVAPADRGAPIAACARSQVTVVLSDPGLRHADCASMNALTSAAVSRSSRRSPSGKQSATNNLATRR